MIQREVIHNMFRVLFTLLLAAAAWAQPPIEILRATYGAGRNQTDVTERIRANFVNGGITLVVNADTMGGDPIPNTKKALTVIYRQGAQRRTIRVSDFETLQLGAAAAPVLRITRAQYGDGRRMKDVTEILNSKIASNRLELAIQNANLGGDPAPAEKKHIIVEYEYNGRAATANLAEGQTLILPDGMRTVAPVTGLKILSATYGSGRRAMADVTAALTSRVSGSSLEVVVGTAALGIDPAPNTVKTVTVDYELNGVRQSATARDGETLRINVAAPVLRILNATYTGGRRSSANVTAAVAARVSNGTLDLPVNASTLGADPAPRSPKTLTVEYELNGQRQTASARDGESLRINAAAAASLQIVNATYGVGRRALANVTPAVTARVVNNVLELVVNGETLGIDPAPGQVKTLTVEYELNGQRMTATARDLETMILPAVTTFTIYSATYGVPGRTLNATNAVSSRIVDKRLEIVINDSTLGGDPAPNVVKTLTVDYEVNGRRGTATAQDGQTLRLPGGGASATASSIPSVVPVLGKGPVVTQVAGNRGACLYRQPNYQGESVCFNVGQDIAVMTNAQMGFRSVRLNGASAVDVFEQTNYAGRSWTITSDIADLLSLSGTWWRYEGAAPVQSVRAR